MPSSETRFFSLKMMQAIKKLELPTIENNERFHNDIEKLKEETKIITKPVNSTSIENHQQHRDKQAAARRCSQEKLF